MNLAQINRDRLIDIRNLSNDNFDLTQAALDLAALHRNDIKLAPYSRHLDHIAREVNIYVGNDCSVDIAAEALKQILAKRYGYQGYCESGDDSEAANIATVIDERRGIPISLIIIYLHVARYQGWSASVIDFPNRALLRLDIGSERCILDPFDGGQRLNSKSMRQLLKHLNGLEWELEPIHYKKILNLEILLRLENSVKTSCIKAEQFNDALKAIDNLLLLTPDNPSLWRESGMMHARLHNFAEAILSLEEYLRLDTNGEKSYSASMLLQTLRKQVKPSCQNKHDLSGV